MKADTLLIVITLIVVADFLFEKILEWLNLRNARKDIPEEMKGYYDEEKYRKSIEYKKTNARFGFLTSTLSFAVMLTWLLTGGFGWLDQVLRPYFEHEITLALFYFFILFLVVDLLTLPFQLYRTFRIEEQFGFNTTTLRLFITDKLKGYLLTLLIGSIIGGTLFWLIIEIGPDFWLYFLAVAVGVMIFIQLFYASLILPLFNKLSPLEDGELRDAIMSYAEKLNFSLENIFVIDGSRRSKKANAFFMGIGNKKKIVLYDTLIENHDNEELLAVLAHEMGHYRKKHIISGMLLSILQTGIMLFILSLFVYNRELSIALGGDQLAIHLNLIAFSILYSPISKITGILMNIFSRKNEFEADAFARQTYDGTALRRALKKLSVDNLSNLYPHPAYVFVHYSHPPLLERLQALRNS